MCNSSVGAGCWPRSSACQAELPHCVLEDRRLQCSCRRWEGRRWLAGRGLSGIWRLSSLLHCRTPSHLLAKHPSGFPALLRGQCHCCSHRSPGAGEGSAWRSFGWFPSPPWCFFDSFLFFPWVTQISQEIGAAPSCQLLPKTPALLRGRVKALAVSPQGCEHVGIICSPREQQGRPGREGN